MRQIIDNVRARFRDETKNGHLNQLAGLDTVRNIDCKRLRGVSAHNCKPQNTTRTRRDCLVRWWLALDVTLGQRPIEAPGTRAYKFALAEQTIS